jgi:hypothetical protein
LFGRREVLELARRSEWTVEINRCSFFRSVYRWMRNNNADCSLLHHDYCKYAFPRVPRTTHLTASLVTTPLTAGLSAIASIGWLLLVLQLRVGRGDGKRAGGSVDVGAGVGVRVGVGLVVSPDSESGLWYLDERRSGGVDEWMSGWLSRCLVVRLSGCLVVRLSGCLFIWWLGCLVCLNEWTIGWSTCWRRKRVRSESGW